ncbi:MAG: 5-oxoprolinase subunit B [Mucilaginibacter sp.]
MRTALSIYPISEKAVTIAFGDSISEELMHRINSFDKLIREQPFPGLQTTVPAYGTLSVFFDPLQVLKSDLAGTTCREKVSNYLRQLNETETTAIKLESQPVTIPVCYGGELGPDLADVAVLNKITTEEVINLHSTVTYLVHMIGFVPGFAYLGGMPETIAAPRKATPRAVIPAGSVGIAGMQTGIYPLQTPGGWQLIGQTPVKLFDPARPVPALLKAGDRVQFKSIEMDEFRHLQKTTDADTGN